MHLFTDITLIKKTHWVENCPWLDSFSSTFSRIRTEYGELLCKSPYSAKREKIRTIKTSNTDTF